MTICIVLEHRFILSSDGVAWTKTMFDYEYWERYLSEFTKVRVIARATSAQTPPEGYCKVNGRNVEFLPLPFYKGPLGYIFRFPALIRVLRENINHNDAILLRVPSPISSIVVRLPEMRRRVFGVEVVGDPWDVFAPRCIDHALRPILRFVLYYEMRKICQRSSVNAYVTREYLQRRYPARLGRGGCGKNVFSFPNVSDVSLNLFMDHRIDVSEKAKRGPVIIVSVCSLEQPYKGVDILIDAVKQLDLLGCNVRLRVIGGGRLLKRYHELADAYQLGGKVEFLGELRMGQDVFIQLAKSDIFVLASRTEGMPRALLEAMASGLPCVASAVGGIPEIMDPEALFPSNNSKALVKIILRIINDVKFQEKIVESNRQILAMFSDSVLDERRKGFYTHLKELTLSNCSKR